MLSASGTRLPVKCQLPALRARATSRRIRTHVAILLALYTGWASFQIIGSISNAARESNDAFARYLLWTYATDSRRLLQIAILLLPRLLFQLFIFCMTASFMGWLLCFKHEPIEYRLDQFLLPQQYPTVDVFLPRYKEPWSLYGPVVQSALDIKYPSDKLAIYVLDDGQHDPIEHKLQELDMSAGHTLVYLQRPTRESAKAGNLNNALQYSNGKVIMVMDADFITKEDALEVVMPHILDLDKQGGAALSEIALVQTPQIFYNTDVPMVRFLDGPMTMVYDLWHPSMSGLGMTHCYGTSYIVRRAALESIGGWSTTTLAEDVPTSMELQAKGWKSKYVAATIAEGQSPQSLAELYAQRLRWTAANAQLLCYLKPFADRRLPVLGRISYTLSNYGWCMSILFWVLLSYLMIGWITFQFITKESNVSVSSVAVSLSQLISSMITGLAFFLLPKISIRKKLENVMSFLCCMPIFTLITVATIAGKLRPGASTLKLKQSCEAAGSNHIPPLAYLNILVVVVTTGLYAVLVVPGLGMQRAACNYLVCGLQVLFIWFCNWPAIFAVLCGLLDITFKEPQPPNQSETQTDAQTIAAIEEGCQHK